MNRIVAGATMIACALVARTPNLEAQTDRTLTLQEALQLGDQYNPTIRQNRIDAALNQRKQSGAWRDLVPQFSGGYSTQLYGTGQSAYSGFRSFSSKSSFSSLDLHIMSIPFLDGGRSVMQHRNDADEQAAALIDLEYRNFQQRQNIADAFYGALNAQRQVALADSQLVQATEGVDRIQRLLRAGTRDVPDLLQAQIRVKQQKLALRQARAVADQQRRVLRLTIGTPDTSDFEVSGDLPAVFDPSIFRADSLTAAALAGHPSVATDQAMIASAGRQIANYRRSQWLAPQPQLSISRRVTGNDLGSAFNAPTGFNNYLVGFSFSVPFLDRFGSQRWKELATYEQQRDFAGEAVRQKRLKVSSDIHGALIDLRAAYDTYQSLLDIRKDRAELYEMRRTQYERGTVTLDQLEGALEQLNTADKEVIDAQLNFTRARLALEKAIGHPLSR